MRFFLFLPLSEHLRRHPHMLLEELVEERRIIEPQVQRNVLYRSFAGAELCLGVHDEGAVDNLHCRPSRLFLHQPAQGGGFDVHLPGIERHLVLLRIEGVHQPDEAPVLLEMPAAGNLLDGGLCRTELAGSLYNQSEQCLQDGLAQQMPGLPVEMCQKCEHFLIERKGNLGQREHIVLAEEVELVNHLLAHPGFLDELLGENHNL